MKCELCKKDAIVEATWFFPTGCLQTQYLCSGCLTNCWEGSKCCSIKNMVTAGKANIILKKI